MYQAVTLGTRIYSCSVEIFLSDLIVIWRAWVLFQGRQSIILIPFILWIVAVGEWIYSVKLFPFAESISSGMAVGDQIWISIPKNYDQLDSKLDGSLTTASITLSMATNAVTTTMIAYKLWYVAVGIHWILGFIVE